jgi:UDPglucose--hexose-1-phosphate uridylyltransferase
MRQKTIERKSDYSKIPITTFSFFPYIFISQWVTALMKLESYERKATLTTKDGEVTHTVIHRRDPLTGRISSICPNLKEKWSSFVGETDRELIQKLAEDSASWCPFCQSIEDITPTVSYAPEGRWHIDDVWVFPNMFPRTAFEAVVTSSENHFLWLHEFSGEFVSTHLRAAVQCIRDVYAKTPSLSYAAIGWNYLPPAGASLVHPHMQVSMRDMQFNYPEFLEEKSREYFEEYHSNFWEDIIQKERHIKTSGRIEWVTPYAPTGFNEIWGIVKSASNFMELETEDIQNLGEGISNILHFYSDRGCSAFNMVIHSGCLSEHSDHFWLGAKLVSRSNVRSLYLNIDSWYMPKLLWEEIVAESPEELAEAVREYF